MTGGKAGLAGSNFLLGIVHGWFPNHEPESQARHALNTGITGVIPAVRIMDILDSDEYVELREAIVKYKNENGPRMKTAVLEKDKSEEYERFEQLAQRLVNTPKSKAATEGEASQ